MLKNNVNGENVDVKVLCVKAECINCSNGSLAIFMTVRNKDGECTAKLWSAQSSDTDQYIDKAMHITGTIKEYKGVKEINIGSVEVLQDSEITKLVPRLDLDNLCKEFMQFLKSHITKEYFEALKVIFEAVGFENYVTAYAANSHHDNICGGLINHTLKMLQIAEVILTQHSKEIGNWGNRIYTGIVLHDIGKIYCYTKTGSVAELNYVDHKALGIEILSQNKDAVVEKIGVDEYYQLMAIILGHHGEFGEPCHSVATQIVSYIDLLDSQVTGLIQLMKQQDYKGDIRFDNRYLHI